MLSCKVEKNHGSSQWEHKALATLRNSLVEATSVLLK